jgi:ABC-type branched-subunit amino acid transport system substrate-binding protein
MRRVIAFVVVLLCSVAYGQTFTGCSCGSNPPGKPKARTMKPYAQEPEDLRPYSKFTVPYYEHYTDLVEYNGASRDYPMAKDVDEVRIGFIGPMADHPDAAIGERMLNGASMAVDEANAAGGYGGKPFKLMLHNDSAVWGASSNELVKMAYDDKVWAIFGSISGDTTHIALRVSLRAEVPIVNSASTDPTIVETIIPWYFTDLQDDRTQGYTLARHIYTELGLKRIAILRVNDRYGRFGVIKFRDASRRLGHPVVIEQKFMPYDTDMRRQLRVINDSRVDGIVLWTDEPKAALILRQMQELGMGQKVFGSHRTIGNELVKLAGSAGEGFQAVYPYDPSSKDPAWLAFEDRFAKKYGAQPDHFAALAYDQIQILLKAICVAGLNRAMIRDALYGTTHYKGVTGEMSFDPNDKQIRPMYLGTVHNGRIEYRPATMEKEYAKVGEDGVSYAGPETMRLPADQVKIALFGVQADERIREAEVAKQVNAFAKSGRSLSLVPINSEQQWGKASNQLVHAIYEDKVVGIIALDRAASHLAEQIGVKAFVPVLAVSSDKSLTSINIPWIFRLPDGTSIEKALEVMTAAVQQAGPDRAKVRELLSSGAELANVKFSSTGEPVAGQGK